MQNNRTRGQPPKDQTFLVGQRHKSRREGKTCRQRSGVVESMNHKGHSHSHGKEWRVVEPWRAMERDENDKPFGYPSAPGWKTVH